MGMAFQTVTFASAEEMEQRSQGAIPKAHPFLEKELRAATETIRKRCGWHIAEAETLTFDRVGPFAEQVWLPAMEIAAVSEAVIDGRPVNASTVEFDKSTGWTSLRGRRRRVTYTAGFDVVPADLVTLTLELAAGALGSPLGITREQAGGVSVTLTRSSGALAAEDLDRLAAYTIGYVP